MQNINVLMPRLGNGGVLHSGQHPNCWFIR